MDDNLHLVTAPPVLSLHELFSDVAWSQVFFLTYSFDLPFFESYLLPKLVRKGSCTISIAADAAWLAEALPRWLENGDVREAGRSYVLCGVRVPGAFHPKLMLAASEQSGTVLVGSGNLSTFGMTSAGELFTVESWRTETPSALAQHAWALCREMAQRLPIDPLFGERIEAMGRQIPKLALSSQGGLFHNLDEPLLDQFARQIGARPVREVLLWAPFTDHRLEAVQHLIVRLRPQAVTLAVQPGKTSIDGDRLAALVATYGDIRWRFVELVQRYGHDLIHAKGILVTLSLGKEWLLAGSANLSTPALLRTAADGNYEIAYCIHGSDLRATIFADDSAVTLGGDILLDQLRWQDESDTVIPLTSSVIGVDLLGAVWDGEALRLSTNGICPPGVQAVVNVTLMLPVVINDGALEVRGFGEQEPVSVALEWNGTRSAPVIVSHLPRLRAMAARTPTVTLVPLEALDYGDESEIVALLEQLAQMTISTRHDLARLVRGSGPPTEREEADEANERAPLVDLHDIDFRQVRQHPRASMYDRDQSGYGDAPRLQIWLDEIVQQFDLLRDRQLRLVTMPVVGEEEDEAEPTSEPAAPRRWSLGRRVRIRIRNRVRRYIVGLSDPELWRVVRPDWMAINYSIFLHVLDRLWIRLQDPPTAILPLEDMAELTADMLAGFWGCDERAGYWLHLDEDDAILVGLHLLEHRSHGLTLAMAARLLELSGTVSQRAPFITAGVARALEAVGLLTDEAAEQALVYLGRPDEDPRPLRHRVAATTEYFTWRRFCDILARRQQVARLDLRSDLYPSGDTLVVKDRLPIDEHPNALALFSAWILEEQRRKPQRRAFQMVWNSNEHGLLYFAEQPEELIWRRATPAGTTENLCIAEGVGPRTFGAWKTLSQASPRQQRAG